MTRLSVIALLIVTLIVINTVWLLLNLSEFIFLDINMGQKCTMHYKII